jgi:hypothetical protein
MMLGAAPTAASYDVRRGGDRGLNRRLQGMAAKAAREGAVTVGGGGSPAAFYPVEADGPQRSMHTGVTQTLATGDHGA